MTDTNALITRLEVIAKRFALDEVKKAADALEAQARRIAELEYDATYHEGNDEVMMRDIEYYRARIAELEAALKPFADAADDLEDTEHGSIWESPASHCITAGDLRAARAALGEKE